MPTIEIDEDELLRLLSERDQLRKQVDEVRDDMNKLVNGSLARRVRAFHQKFGHPVEWTPRVPDNETMRFRVKLIAEEFFELLRAIFPGAPLAHESVLWSFIEHAPIQVDLPELVDAIEDSKYVLEGTHAVCGVNADPIATAIHEANMAKNAVYVEEKDGFKRGERIKPEKPAGWQPPNIDVLLRCQGWSGPNGGAR